MYQISWAKQTINIVPQGYAMFGYGQWNHRAHGQQTMLYARAFCIQDAASNLSIFCCLDMGCVTHAMRQAACEQLKQKFKQQLNANFNESAFVLTATHTHSAPGGCSHDALYNMPTPGFVPEHLAAVTQAIVDSVMHAWQRIQPTEIKLASDEFAADIPVAWNRSLAAYNCNPDVIQYNDEQHHLALDRRMNSLGFYRDGKLHALLSLFGVHATCIGSSLDQFDGDNKGYAAEEAEHWLVSQGVDTPVAIFAQATAGDVSPHFHGKDQLARRNRIKGYAEYVYAQQNGNYQSDLALSMLSLPTKNTIYGLLDSILSYMDFSCMHVDDEFANGEEHAYTSDPCHGAAFFAGTPVDGLGTPAALAKTMALMAKTVKSWRLSYFKKSNLETTYYQQLYASQGSKAIVLECGKKRILGRALDSSPSAFDPLLSEMNRQVKAGAIVDSAMVPSVVPLQILILGQLALLCCPGEFTTMAGQRLVNTVTAILQPHGIDQVLLCSYCNDYMGYVTTFEEYQQQAYEGGHTLFGQWTLAAFQTGFSHLAQQLVKPVAQRDYDQHTKPTPVPEHELALRTNHGNLKTAVH